MVPASTREPVLFSTGTDSPVIAASFTVLLPSITSPSSPMRSKGRTSISSPMTMSSNGTSSTRPSARAIAAVSGARSASDATLRSACSIASSSPAAPSPKRKSKKAPSAQCPSDAAPTAATNISTSTLTRSSRILSTASGNVRVLESTALATSNGTTTNGLTPTQPSTAPVTSNRPPIATSRIAHDPETRLHARARLPRSRGVAVTRSSTLAGSTCRPPARSTTPPTRSIAATTRSTGHDPSTYRTSTLGSPSSITRASTPSSASRASCTSGESVASPMGTMSPSTGRPSRRPSGRGLPHPCRRHPPAQPAGPHRSQLAPKPSSAGSGLGMLLGTGSISGLLGTSAAHPFIGHHATPGQLPARRSRLSCVRRSRTPR